MVPMNIDTSTTAMPSNYKMATSYGYVYVQAAVQYATNCDSTTDTTANFQNIVCYRNRVSLPEIEVMEIDDALPPAVYPHRVIRLKLCPYRTRPLSNPMALCYWAQAPPH